MPPTTVDSTGRSGIGVTAVVAAAGLSRRMGAADKLILPLGGLPIIRMTVERVLAAGPEETLVVVGPGATSLRDALLELPVRFVDNLNPERGMGVSIATGVRASRPGTAGLLICLADMPFVESATYRRLLMTFERAGRESRPIVIPSLQGRRGQPVLFDAAYRNALEALDGDVGGRNIVVSFGKRVVDVEVDDEGILADVDTPSAYEAFARRADRRGAASSP